MRPVRNYLHTFVHPSGAALDDIPASGETPCKAKNNAFVRLEYEIVERELPPEGWRLARQRQV